MSGNGRLRAILEARRKEKIRLENVKAQCRGLISAYENEIQQLESSIIQSVGDQLVDTKAKLGQLKNSLEKSPDATLEGLNNYRTELVGIINKGKQSAKKWDQYREDWENAMLSARLKVESLADSKFKVGKEGYEGLTKEILKLGDMGFENTDITKFRDIEDRVQEIHREIDRDNETREIIKSVRKILNERGFTPSKPKYSKEKEGTIELVGMLSPGRNAKFWISTQGEIEFDFEGYSGTSCKETIDEIAIKLKKTEDIESEITQFEWHNPDKIEKGTKDFPMGGQARSRNQ